MAAPNHGTALADADHMVSFVDRYTSVLNLAPPGPLQVVSEILEAIVTVVKVVGHAVANGLPGIDAMDPKGELHREHQRRPRACCHLPRDRRRLPADRRVAGPGEGRGVNLVADRIFENAANDLVVPTLGVSRGSADPVFPIKGDRALTFPDSSRGHAHQLLREARDVGTVADLAAGLRRVNEAHQHQDPDISGTRVLGHADARGGAVVDGLNNYGRVSKSPGWLWCVCSKSRRWVTQAAIRDRELKRLRRMFSTCPWAVRTEDEELRGDVGVGQPVGDQVRDLELPPGQR